MYSKLNKKINSCKNLNFANQPTCKKYRLVVHSDCHRNVANLRASWLCFLEQSPSPLICPLQQKFLIVKSVHKKPRRRLTKNVNLKRELLTVPPWQRRQNLIEVKTCTENTEFQNLKIECASSQFYHYNEWLCGSWFTKRD